jgi:hypothetical protein
MLVAALLGATACDRHVAPPKRAAPSAPRDTRPFTPWHAAGEPLPFPATEWYWQDLFAAAPAPEPLGTDPDAAREIAAAFERIAKLDVLASEAELPALVDLAHRDLAALLAAEDDPRREVRYAAARVALRLMAPAEGAPPCPFPQRLVEAAARHLRDRGDEVALLHLETIARGHYPWMWPILLKTFGKVDNHRLTVLRVRAAADLARQGCYGGIPLLIKVLKEGTSIQDDVNREWDTSLQVAWWKEEAIAGIEAVAHDDFGHSPDASDAAQVAAVRRIEAWWAANRVALWAARPLPDDPELQRRIRMLILAFGTFQLRNVDNAAFLLTGLGPQVAPTLFEALPGSNFRIRHHLLGVIAALCDDAAPAVRETWLAKLVPLQDDPDESVRLRTLEAIGATRIPAALPHLEAALRPEEAARCETALHQLSLQEPQAARRVLQEFATKLPQGHLLATPLAAARLRAGDLAPLPDYLARLSGQAGSDARAQLYLSWIVDVDELSDAKDPTERAKALSRLEAAIRARAAASGSGS